MKKIKLVLAFCFLTAAVVAQNIANGGEVVGNDSLYSTRGLIKPTLENPFIFYVNPKTYKWYTNEYGAGVDYPITLVWSHDLGGERVEVFTRFLSNKQLQGIAYAAANGLKLETYKAGNNAYGFILPVTGVDIGALQTNITNALKVATE